MSYVCGGREDGDKRLYCCRLMFSAAPEFFVFPFRALSPIFPTAPHIEQKLWLNWDALFWHAS